MIGTKIFPFLVNFVPHLVGLPSLPKSDFFWGNPRSRSKSLPFSILCMFFFEEKKTLSLLFFPHESHESHESLFVFCFVAQKSHSFHGELAAGPRSELCRQGQAAQAAQAEKLECLEKV
jgi:hypothetical protein